MGLQLQLEYPNPSCLKHNSGKVITAEKLKAELTRCQKQRLCDAVHEQNWQGKLISARGEDEMPNKYSGGNV